MFSLPIGLGFLFEADAYKNSIQSLGALLIFDKESGPQMSPVKSLGKVH